MIADFRTVLWKEWKELLLAPGDLRTSLLMLVLPVIVMGVVLPWQAGRAWLESPITLIAWAWIPLFLVINVIADSFAGERERRTLETLLATRLPDRAILFGKMGAAIAYAWGLTLVILLVGLVTVNVKYGFRELLTYAPTTLVAAVGLSLLATTFISAAGVFVSLRSPTTKQAQQRLSIAVMVLFFVPFFGLQALPPSWVTTYLAFAMENTDLSLAVAASVLLVLDAALVGAAGRRFQRSRLILD
jgi:ABC-2 type transport system permease protein